MPTASAKLVYARGARPQMAEYADSAGRRERLHGLGDRGGKLWGELPCVA